MPAFPYCHIVQLWLKKSKDSGRAEGIYQKIKSKDERKKVIFNRAQRRENTKYLKIFQ